MSDIATATATERKQVRITLTDRAPILLWRDEWPCIASAKDWDNQYECQANRTWHLKVRQHEDGRTVVYGWHDSQFQGARALRAGEILAAGEDIAAAIHRVAADCDCEGIADQCIGHLPAEEVNGELPARPLPAGPAPDLAALRESVAALAQQLITLADTLGLRSERDSS